MPLYRCLIHGTAYVLNRGNGDEKTGFWTTRDVRAFSRSRAMKKATDLIRNDEYLAAHIVPELSQAAKIEIDEIGIVTSALRKKPAGFTFYAGDDADNEWKKANVSSRI